MSLAVPNLRNITNGLIANQDNDDTTTTNFTNNDVRVSRSVSDVFSKQRQENVECRRQLSSPAAIPDNADQQQQKQLAGRGTFCDRVSS